jgi:hypothetical protein
MNASRRKLLQQAEVVAPHLQLAARLGISRFTNYRILGNGAILTR